MAVPTAITKITNIESKARRTLRKLILSQQAVPVECRRPRILRQRPPLGICLLLQCGRGPLSMFVLRLIGVLGLIVLNGFFAAAEFSLVAVRICRVRQLVAKGNLRAPGVETLG